MNLTTKITGLPELLRELKRLSDAGQGRVARNMAMAGARVVAKHARALAPRDTGKMASMIKARRGRNQVAKGQALAFANSRSRLSHLHEFGTSKMRARPFLRPALDANGAEIRAKMVEIGLRGLEREIKRQQVIEDLGEE
jgi:HK97 gp10 family phage protein